ncbi:hypothetical protein A9K55_002143 [Cordyceps militaris]|uniref:Uncharacterized protein n=1 Tax=Cordyceps militaris TaxID=73501 RepID=A0A2H4SSQ6_CORMI|nr:hypothetical protein A9K55_002143 [Cordyceps militaris]
MGTVHHPNLNSDLYPADDPDLTRISAAAFNQQQVLATTIPAPRGNDGAPARNDVAPGTCSEATEHKDKPRAPTPTSPGLPQCPAYRAASGSNNGNISDSQAESDWEADDEKPSVGTRNTLVDKEATQQAGSASPALTTTTVPNTPRDVLSGFEEDDDLNRSVQHAPPPSLATSGGRVELSQQPKPQESASQNVPASSDSDGGSGGEDGGHRRKRTTDRSPFVICSDDGRNDGTTDDGHDYGRTDDGRKSLRLHKRRKVSERLL